MYRYVGGGGDRGMGWLCTGMWVGGIGGGGGYVPVCGGGGGEMGEGEAMYRYVLGGDRGGGGYVGGDRGRGRLCAGMGEGVGGGGGYVPVCGYGV